MNDTRLKIFASSSACRPTYLTFLTGNVHKNFLRVQAYRQVQGGFSVIILIDFSLNRARDKSQLDYLSEG